MENGNYFFVKKLLLSCGLCLALAIFISLKIQPIPIEHRLIQIRIDEVLNDFPGIADQPVEIQALLLDMADDPLLLVKAEAAFLRYPDMARTIFSLYGAEAEFQDILRRYGENILPPIHHFISRPIASIELRSQALKRYESIKQYLEDAPGDVEGGAKDAAESAASEARADGKYDARDDAQAGARDGARDGAEDTAAPEQPVDTTPGTLSPAERGWWAVNFIQSEGHDFLGQFIVDSRGDTQWVETERVLEGVTRFFTSGIRDLEISYRLGETITAGDIGWASVDVLAFAGALKVLRMGKALSATARGANLSTRSAALATRLTQGARMVLRGARYAKWPVIIGAGYVVITHPSLINDLLAEIADVLGYPVLATQIAGWFLLLLPVLYLGRWLLWLVAALARRLPFASVV